MAINPIQIAKQLMTSKGRDELANQMLSNLPQETRNYLLKYKTNPMKGIEEGVKEGKISQKEISQLRPFFQKARMFGIRLPMDKLDEIEQLAKNNSNFGNSNSNKGFKIF